MGPAVWLAGGRADTLTLLPDSLPDLPLKEQELLGGCPTRQTAAGMAGPLSEAKSQQRVPWGTSTGGKDGIQELFPAQVGSAAFLGLRQLLRGTLCYL